MRRIPDLLVLLVIIGASAAVFVLAIIGLHTILGG